MERRAEYFTGKNFFSIFPGLETRPHFEHALELLTGVILTLLEVTDRTK
ncbi:MAG TPA: hypothetical protein VHO03_04120 [Ignavibacteriales bacterium]|nr:hypothetical protein [Ignavibacteriales bacterium]